MSRDLIYAEVEMQKKCDLYLCESANSELLKFVSIFDKSFSYEIGKTYSGYLHVGVDRVKLVTVVSDLRRNKISCFSVPIEYRDHENITIESAFVLANEYAKTRKASVAYSAGFRSKSPPVFWVFDLIYENGSDEKAGGVVMIDRLDGHVWSDCECEVYMYDYNNLF